MCIDGSNEATRKVAAKHISEISKLHPPQLPAILRKVRIDLWRWGVGTGDASRCAC